MTTPTTNPSGSPKLQHDFERSTCACEHCVACCKRQPGSLIDGDFERIVEFTAKKQNWSFEVALEWVKKHLWASPGALVMTQDGLHRVGSITPQMRKGKCVFLDDNDRCTIHAVSPFGCAYYSTHMPAGQAQERSVFAVRSQVQPAYQALRNQLPYARSYKPNYL
jgi:Fe-S-cluster containining protein